MATLATRPLAVVTGGSSGIGLELARQFISNGFDVAIAGTRRAHDAQRELQRDGASVYAVAVDLATREGCDKLCEEVRGGPSARVPHRCARAR